MTYTKWKKVKNWPNYEAHPDGLIRRVGSNKTLSIFFIRGYASVNFSNGKQRKSARIHRIVSECFIPNPLNKPAINHIDGDKTNNGIANLEWCTYSENEIHSYQALNKRHPMTKVEKSTHAIIQKRYANGEKQINLAKEYGVSKQHLWAIVHQYKQRRKTT